MTQKKFKIGDKVRVKQIHDGKPGPTLWEITALQGGSACYIREAGTDYAEQRFDLSLLERSK